MKMSILYVFFVLFFTGYELETAAPIKTGFVNLKVTIAPLCGIVKADDAENTSKNPCGLSDEAMDAIYAQYKISINNVANTTNYGAIEKTMNRTGIVNSELPVGTYTVQVILPDGAYNKQATSEIKKTIEIKEGATTEVAIRVDTGYQ